MASRFDWGKGFAENGKWTGKVEPNYKVLKKLEKRVGSERKLKPKVFCIWNDFFHPQIRYAFQLRALHAMYYLEQDVFLILTKRPEEIKNSAFSQGPFEDTDLSNVYLGVSVESQKYIHRIDELIQNWPGKKFVSIEPCLSAVELSPEQLTALDQVIIGGESGPKARPMQPDWARSIRDQCQDAGVSYFLKQRGQWLTAEEVSEYLGEDTPILRDTWPSRINRNIDRGRLQVVDNTTMCRVTKKDAGRLLDGRHWDQLTWNIEKGTDEH